MQIKTELLQKMLAKAIQGASNNKMIPLTSLLGIEIKDNTITLMTTDGSNQFRVIEKIENAFEDNESKEFYTIVNADTFSKLVGKTTKEFIKLESQDNYLSVMGNGIYKLEIPINEDGDIIRFPEIKSLEGNRFELKLNALQESIRTAKASVAKTMEIPLLTGYYIGNNIITTNRQMICTIQNNEIPEPILISSEMAELLLLVEESETLSVIKQNNEILLSTNNYIIYGKELEGKENYPVDSIEKLLKVTYANTVKVDKQALLNILDRMSLFVTEYDKNGIYLTFDINEGLIITSQTSNAEEIVEFKDNTPDSETFKCLADIEMLKSQIQNLATDIVTINYGQKDSLRLIEGNTIIIISLLEKVN